MIGDRCDVDGCFGIATRESYVGVFYCEYHCPSYVKSLTPATKNAPMQYPIIGIFGRMNAGKSTLAALIRDTLVCYPRSSDDITSFFVPRITGFAHALKDVVSNVFGMTRERIEELKNDPAMPPQWQVNMRTCLQTVGEMVRSIQPTAWIDKTLTLSQEYPVIVEDGRHLNEFDSIKSKGGYCIVVDRLRDGDKPAEGLQYAHASETGVMEILRNRTADAWVHNNDNISTLEKYVRAILVPSILKHFGAKPC